MRPNDLAIVLNEARYSHEDFVARTVGVSRLHYAFGRDADHDVLLTGAIAKAARAGRRNGLTTPETFHHPSLLLHELRLRKNREEIDCIKRAASITAQAHLAAMQCTAPGIHEFDIEAELVRTFQRSGSNGVGYTPIVAAGNNANVLHYVRNRAPLCDGDLLLVDAGCEVSYYTADVTRTWPINGRFTDAQRRVYTCVLDAQVRAIEQCRPGTPHAEIHHTALRALTEGMVELGLLKGPVEDRIEDESYKKWYPHGTSHRLGLDVHDVGSYGRNGRSRALEPGMVLTVEPGLYIPLDAQDAPAELRGIGVRLEDDVLITESAPEVLTADAPKTLDEVEAAMA